LAMQ